MEQGYQCPTRGKPLEFLSQSQNWYCDSCKQFSSPRNLQKVYPLPLKNQSTTAIWLLVIAVLSVVILTFIAAAALYLMVGGTINGDTSPTGAIDFSESTSEPGVYMGGFTTLSKDIDLEYVSLTITDHSLGESASLEPLVDGCTVVISGGLRCSFSDVNQNNELDTEDIFRIEGVGVGDIMKFVYKPTGGTIALHTFA